MKMCIMLAQPAELLILLWKWKKELYTSLFRRMQIQNKEKMSKFIKAELESESESELQSDTESKPKSELEPDPEYW